MAVGILSEKEMKKQFEAVRKRAEKLGVLDICFSRSASSPDALQCYNSTLDVIEQNKDVIYKNAGEA